MPLHYFPQFTMSRKVHSPIVLPLEWSPRTQCFHFSLLSASLLLLPLFVDMMLAPALPDRRGSDIRSVYFALSHNCCPQPFSTDKRSTESKCRFNNGCLFRCNIYSRNLFLQGKNLELLVLKRSVIRAHTPMLSGKMRNWPESRFADNLSKLHAIYLPKQSIYRRNSWWVS